MSPFRLDGKSALVTGASRGLGAAIALALAEAGADVVLHASRQAPTDTQRAITTRTKVRTATVVGDLADRAVSDRLVDEAVHALGALDILINNAGTIRRMPAVDFSDADWDAVIEVNLTSAFRLCRAAGRHMLARGSGKIVNVASLLSLQGGITVPAYAAAKGGLAQLTKALANEWAGRGVNVNAIAPGYMRTDNTQALQDDAVRSKQILDRIPAGRWGEPSDLGGAAVFLSSSAANYVHGHLLVVDGGWLGR
jgi:2-deoxy-D-gluconate 3-dehydrogenase